MNKLLLLLICIHTQLQGQIILPRLIRDSVVLQRDEPLKIWGKAGPKEKLLISIDGKKYKTQANETGDWSCTMDAHPAGGPYELFFKGKTELRLKDVLFGDVWLCTGQSNMVLPMERVKEVYPEDIKQANYPHIRNFFIKTMTDLNGPQKDLPGGHWVAANPNKVLDFGAVSYFFARDLYDRYKVPIGIINSSVGGTPIEAWISEAGFKDFASIQKSILQNKNKEYIDKRLQENKNRLINRPMLDKGWLEKPKWFEPSYEAKDWYRINIPGYWEDQGINNLDGVVWYRRTIDVPTAMCGVEAKLFMGRIVDADHVYVNDSLVGTITYQYPPRRYTVRAGILKPGKNVITVRVVNTGGKGGFVPDKPYYLTANGKEIDLKGDWFYKIGQVYEPVQGFSGFSAQNQPSSLFNAMTAPIVAQMNIKGVLWYQGESNTGNPTPYGSLLNALIQDYRTLWNKPKLPFLYVQLANFMEQDPLPVESNWAQLRHQQTQALKLDLTAMAVAIDLGEWNDIHPLNKKEVGLRLALGARALTYGESTLTYSGPIYRSHTIQGNTISIQFDHLGSGLKSLNGQALTYFSIAGEDKKYVWADAHIDGNQVIVSSPHIKHPHYVRYAWANNPVGANLGNKEGLPASPFEAGNTSKSGLWQGKEAAVVLTYDDALEVHLDHVIPALDSMGLKGSFYLSAAFPGSTNRINDWKRVAMKGHELGNHTLYHPCAANKPGRSWVQPLNDLNKYTTAQIVREVEMTNTFLESLDGKKERTFAYTCGDTETGEGSFIDAIKSQFVALRGVKGMLNKQDGMDYTNINCFVIDNSNADQMVHWAEQAKKENALLVVLFHGVGGGHGINIDLDKHHSFLRYLQTHQDEYWITTMLEAAKHSSEFNKK